MNDPIVIERIRSLEIDGEITPDRVIEDARQPDSPLHPFFEWDKDIAHQKYLVEQARTLIRSVRLVVHRNKHQLTVVGYVRDPDKEPKEQGYISTVRLKTEKARARDALIKELRFAESALQRAYDVAESLDLSKDVERLLAQVRSITTAA